MEILKGEVFELYNAVSNAQEAKTDDFTLRLLQSERNSGRSQLSSVRRGFESDLVHLSSELLAHNEELSSIREELTCSQKCSKRLAQELATTLEKNRRTALDLSESWGALEELQKHHQQYKDNRKDLVEELRKSSLAFLAKDR